MPEPSSYPAVDEQRGPIVLYDGVCGLCHWTVTWLLRRDRDGRLRFAPLQGATAAELRARYPRLPEGLASVVVVDGGRVYVRSKAFVRIAGYLPPPWRWGRLLGFMPGWLLDPGYWLIARLRYRIWGRLDACSTPRGDVASRLLP